MREWLIAQATRLATAAGAELVVEPFPSLDPTDKALLPVAEGLQTRANEAGIRLIALHRAGSTLHVLLDDSDADEPLSPGALQSAVRQISWDRLGQVWDTELHALDLPTPNPAVPMQADLPSVGRPAA